MGTSLIYGLTDICKNKLIGSKAAIRGGRKDHNYNGLFQKAGTAHIVCTVRSSQVTSGSIEYAPEAALVAGSVRD